MGADLNITKLLQDYILKYGLKLHPVQKEIINYNLSLGDIKRMQISISQCQFLHLIIKVSKIKRVLEIGTFTGLSTLSMALALPEDGEITAVDKDKNTSKKANEFFKGGCLTLIASILSLLLKFKPFFKILITKLFFISSLPSWLILVLISFFIDLKK